GAVLGRSEYRHHLGHAVAVKYRADAFVVVQGDGVAAFIRARYRDDFFVPPGFACGLRTLVALGGVVVLFLPRYTPLVGDAFSAFDLVGDVEAAHQVGVQVIKTGEIALAQCQVQEHGHAAHAFDAASDGEVQVLHAHGLCGGMQRVLAGTTHAVHGDAGHGLGQAGQQQCLPSDVAALLTRLAYATGQDITNTVGRYATAGQQGLQHRGQQGVGAGFSQGAATPPEGAAYSVNNHGLIGGKLFVLAHGSFPDFSIPPPHKACIDQIPFTAAIATPFLNTARAQ